MPSPSFPSLLRSNARPTSPNFCRVTPPARSRGRLSSELLCRRFRAWVSLHRAPLRSGAIGWRSSALNRCFDERRRGAELLSMALPRWTQLRPALSPSNPPWSAASRRFPNQRARLEDTGSLAFFLKSPCVFQVSNPQSNTPSHFTFSNFESVLLAGLMEIRFLLFTVLPLNLFRP